MALRLADGVFAVQLSSDLVFLVPQDDAYFCLPLDPGALVLTDDEVAAHVPGLAEALIDSGLVEPAMTGAALSKRAPPSVPTRTARQLIEDQIKSLDRRPRLRHARALCAAVLEASRFRSRPIGELIRVAMDPDEAAPSASLLTDLNVFRRLTPWLPIDGLCLFRSHMLLRYLTALGHRASWVFGVRTWPFRAHCWLQVGDVALDDEAERLSAYAPIMVV